MKKTPQYVLVSGNPAAQGIVNDAKTGEARLRSD